MIPFPRLYRPACTVSIAGQSVVALGVPPTVAPRVAFRVRRTLASTPDTAHVSVYGLEETRRAALGAVWHELGRAKVLLASGYDGVVGSLFAGDARELHPTVTIGPELATMVIADDGGDVLADATIPSGLSSTAGITARQMIDVALACFAAKAAETGDTPIAAHPSVDAAVASATPGASTAFYASVSVGKAKDLLDEAARTLGVRWWVRDGLLYMARRGIPTDGLAVALPRAYWLDEPTEDGKGLVRVPTFLDPNIVPGRQIQLLGRVSPFSVEFFRAETCEYAGDTDSGAPFSVSCELRRIVT